MGPRVTVCREGAAAAVQVESSAPTATRAATARSRRGRGWNMEEPPGGEGRRVRRSLLRPRPRRGFAYAPPVPRYRPIDAQQIPRFAGIKTFMRLPHVTDLDGVDAAAVGIPFDTGTSFRPGPRFGPEAIRSVSSLLRPYHPFHRIDLLEALSVVDYGDVSVAPGDTPGSLDRIEAGLA